MALLRALFVAALLVAGIGAAQAAKRVALVVGNGAYQNAIVLPNPANDAADISAKLTDLGFTVITGVDLTRDELEAKLRDFAREVRDAEITLFYYSGHGIQVGGHNYIIPVDAKLDDATSLDFETIDADRVFAYMGGDGRVALAFLDACRDNPLSRRFAQALPKSRSSAVGVGLAAPQTVGSGLFIGFSTAPGDVALDGDGRNSPFTAALLEHIDEPGLEIQQVLTRVKSDVQTATGGDQRPWTNSDLSTEVYLVPASAPGSDIATPQPAPDALPTPAVDTSDQFAYAEAKDLGTIEGWEAFIAAYPDSRLAPLATAALNKLLTAALPEPVAPTPEPVEPEPQPALPVCYVDDVRPPDAWLALRTEPSARKGRQLRKLLPGQEFTMQYEGPDSWHFVTLPDGEEGWVSWEVRRWISC